jgi:hypothetical protein
VINKSQVKQSQKIDLKLFESTSSIIDFNRLPVSMNSSANYFKDEDSSSKKLGTIYETPVNSDSEDVESEISISQLNVQFDEKVNKYVKNNQVEDEEVFEDVNDDKSFMTINRVDFKISDQIDLNFLKSSKFIPVKVFLI